MGTFACWATSIHLNKPTQIKQQSYSSAVVVGSKGSLLKAANHTISSEARQPCPVQGQSWHSALETSVEIWMNGFSIWIISILPKGNSVRLLLLYLETNSLLQMTLPSVLYFHVSFQLLSMACAVARSTVPIWLKLVWAKVEETLDSIPCLTARLGWERLP